jgi:hypothetical protein
MSLSDILWRNQGQVLTPELIVGVLHGAQYADSLVTGEAPEALAGNWAVPNGLRPSSKRLVIDEHARVAEWVANQAGCAAQAWAGYVCLGLEDQGELVAGVVLESFTGRGANIHVAGLGKHWLNRNMLVTCFSYCFNHLKLKRLTGLTPASNPTALEFNKHLGFEVEYIMPDGAKDGDLVIQVLRPETCRFLIPATE